MSSFLPSFEPRSALLFALVSLGLRYQNFRLGHQTKIFRSGYVEEELPQTSATFTVNPIFGHTSAAYTTAIWRDVNFSTRYDYNIHSYDSNFAVGMEVRKERAVIKTKFDTDKVLSSSLFFLQILCAHHHHPIIGDLCAFSSGSVLGHRHAWSPSAHVACCHACPRCPCGISGKEPELGPHAPCVPKQRRKKTKKRRQ